MAYATPSPRPPRSGGGSVRFEAARGSGTSYATEMGGRRDSDPRAPSQHADTALERAAPAAVKAVLNGGRRGGAVVAGWALAPLQQERLDHMRASLGNLFEAAFSGQRSPDAAAARRRAEETFEPTEEASLACARRASCVLAGLAAQGAARDATRKAFCKWVENGLREALAQSTKEVAVRIAASEQTAIEFAELLERQIQSTKVQILILGRMQAMSGMVATFFRRWYSAAQKIAIAMLQEKQRLEKMCNRVVRFAIAAHRDKERAGMFHAFLLWTKHGYVEKLTEATDSAVDRFRRQIARRWRQRGLRMAFSKWEDEWRDTDKAKRAFARVTRMWAAGDRHREQHALEAWKAHTRALADHGAALDARARIAKRAMGRMLFRQAAAGFARWRAAADGVGKAKAAVARAAARLAHAREAAGFRKWKDVVTSGARSDALCRRVVLRALRAREFAAFNRWRDGAAAMAREHALGFKVLSLMSNAKAAAAVRQWRDTVRAENRAREIATRVMSRMLHRAALGAFRAWKADAVESSARAAAQALVENERRAAQLLMGCVLRRFNAEVIGRIVKAWRRTVREASKRRDIVKYFAVRSMRAAARTVFDAWRREAADLARDRHTMRKAVLGMCSATLKKAWAAWNRGVAAAARESDRAALDGVRAAAAAEEKASNDALCVKVLSRISNRLTAPALRQWGLVVQMARRARATVEKTVRRLSVRALSMGFETWVDTLQQRERGRALCTKALLRAQNRRECSAFEAWKAFADGAVEAEAHAARVGKHVVQIMRSKTRKAWRAWDEHVREARDLERRQAKAMRAWQSRRIARGWNRWAYAVKVLGCVEEGAAALADVVDAHHVASLFGRWAEAGAAEARVRLVMQRGLARMTGGAVAAAFDGWRRRAAALRREAFDLEGAASRSSADAAAAEAREAMLAVLEDRQVAFIRSKLQRMEKVKAFVGLRAHARACRCARRMFEAAAGRTAVAGTQRAFGRWRARLQFSQLAAYSVQVIALRHRRYRLGAALELWRLRAQLRALQAAYAVRVVGKQARRKLADALAAWRSRIRRTASMEDRSKRMFEHALQLLSRKRRRGFDKWRTAAANLTAAADRRALRCELPRRLAGRRARAFCALAFRHWAAHWLVRHAAVRLGRLSVYRSRCRLRGALRLCTRVAQHRARRAWRIWTGESRFMTRAMMQDGINAVSRSSSSSIRLAARLLRNLERQQLLRIFSRWASGVHSLDDRYRMQSLRFVRERLHEKDPDAAWAAWHGYSRAKERGELDTRRFAGLREEEGSLRAALATSIVDLFETVQLAKSLLLDDVVRLLGSYRPEGMAAGGRDGRVAARLEAGRAVASPARDGRVAARLEAGRAVASPPTRGAPRLDGAWSAESRRSVREELDFDDVGDVGPEQYGDVGEYDHGGDAEYGDADWRTLTPPKPPISQEARRQGYWS